MFGLAPWRSSKARAFAPNFELLPRCLDSGPGTSLSPGTQHADPAGIRRRCPALVAATWSGLMENVVIFMVK
jgi:hypothetical protein